MTDKHRVLEKPNLKTSMAIIKDAIAKHKCIILSGHCKVEYQGRARSVLEPGDRIVIIKEDGSTLIHRPIGYKPVNWQPSGCYFQINLVDEVLILNVIRRSPSESLKLFFDQIDFLVASKMIDIGRFDLHVSEKEIQEAILRDPTLLEKGFKPIEYEKKIEPGFLDLYGLDNLNKLVVVEIKRIKAGTSAVMQLAKYVDYVRNMANRDVRGILVAPRISKGVQRLLATIGLEYKRIDLKKCAQVLKLAKGKKIQDFL